MGKIFMHSTVEFLKRIWPILLQCMYQKYYDCERIDGRKISSSFMKWPGELEAFNHWYNLIYNCRKNENRTIDSLHVRHLT